MAAPIKRRKTCSTKETFVFPVKYPEILIYIVERGIQRLRLDHIKKLARKKGFPVTENLKDSVTHIVSELETRDQVLEVLKERLSNETAPSLLLKDAEIVSMVWFSSCMEEGAPVTVIQEHRLKAKVKVTVASTPLTAKPCYRDAKYCCQRITPLNHHNKKLTDALEVLEKQADFLGGDHNASRALAFRKASAALKALPRPVRSMHEIENLCDLKGGKHCKRVVQEILEEGFSTEVEDILNDEWFQTMKLFTGIFGCGAATGRKWFDMKLRDLEDVKQSVNLTPDQRYGLEFYDDINTPVTKHEAGVIQQIVAAEVQTIRPGTTVVITGGFSRGKDTGHDVDLLISHPDEGKEEGLLALILNALQKKQLLEYTDVQNSSYSEAAVGQVKRNQVMDHFERCFSIFRLPKHLMKDGSDLKVDGSTHEQEGTDPTSNPEEKTTSRTKNARDLGDAETPRTNNLHETLNRDESLSNVDVKEPDRIIGTWSEGEIGTLSDVKPPLCLDLEAGSQSDQKRDWVVRRVDFIITPQSQYAYALMGWIGSRMFNRSVRDYANREMNMTLTSHGLFDKTKNVLLSAKTQREIFEHLNLDYREPQERNC